MKLPNKFSDREEFKAALKTFFAEAAAEHPEISETRGGRQAAEKLLRQIDPISYFKTRNHLQGAVTKLSPYLTHGVVSLAEVRIIALRKAGVAAGKLIQELAWRDYFQRIYHQIGNGIWKDRESPKTGFRPADYVDEMPVDIESGQSSLHCMNSFSRELKDTGYLHNHVRMWMAAYLIHWRKVSWQTGARWFLRHLLDGDPASNNLSWQWIASTFSIKPYIFNRDSLEQFTDGIYCRKCILRDEGCPFEATYEELRARLFPNQS